ncbi:MAG: DnaB-like helicase C-terminal domain-containing protein [Aquabacterium sp.]|jgi:replicative DNA helicase|uniref:replicative DNA helicase n=1 Tax=Aquabacterium sp. TaxID=1872578 RepID=UPI002A35AB0C|nr:DnaB-like helicase C-terminal domain-containing protein [Aquabacterium sp.]MDX9843725.1 DnaB-like helicase C-terminal domain-containing protein [Aquabacterium sp.]
MTSASESLPWSPEAEQAVLGCLLLDNSLVYRLADADITAEAFYNAAHGRIWSVITTLIGACKAADVITVADALGDEVATCGGQAYLHDLAMSVVSTNSVRGYAAIVVDKAQRRALIRAGDEVQAMTREQESPAVVLDRAQSVLMALKRQDIQVGLNVAGDEHHVLALSQEMPRGDLIDRITANLGRVPLNILAQGIAPDDRDNWGRVVEAREAAIRLPLQIDDQPALSLMTIRAKAQMTKARHGLDVLILDYLQLCAASDRKLSRHHQIEEISRGLKTLAKELDICVMVLSQINRDVAKADREPTLADLKESGAIEEDADVVLLLHPRGEPTGGAQVIACIVAKNRQGEKRRIALRFEGVYQRWAECTVDVSPQAPMRARGSFETGL